MLHRSSFALLTMFVLLFTAASSHAIINPPPFPGAKVSINTNLTISKGEIHILGNAFSWGENLYGGVLKSTHKIAGTVNRQTSLKANDSRRFQGNAMINHGWKVKLPKGKYQLISSIERWDYDANRKLSLVGTYTAPTKHFDIP